MPNPCELALRRRSRRSPHSAPVTRWCCPARSSRRATRHMPDCWRSCARRASCRTGWRARRSSTRARRRPRRAGPRARSGRRPRSAWIPPRPSCWRPASSRRSERARGARGARRVRRERGGVLRRGGRRGRAARRHVTTAEPVAYPELGTEALVRLTLERFPAFVGIDVLGGNCTRRRRGVARAGGGMTWSAACSSRSRAARAPASPRRSRCS